MPQKRELCKSVTSHIFKLHVQGDRCVAGKKDLHESGLLHGDITQSNVLVQNMIHLRIHYNQENQYNQMMIYNLILKHSNEYVIV